MSIDIICLLYNAEKEIEFLYDSLIKQKNVSVNKIKFILTRSNDNSEKILKDKKLDYELIEKENFNHSLTRQKAARKSKADIIVFITQDIIIKNDDWLENLVKPIILNEVDATFSRQISKYNNIEKYIREYNYPDESRIVNKKSINEMGLKTFFFSDVSSAIKRSTFKKLNYYDGKKLTLSEDMYIAYKLIMNNYEIKYCSDSIVYHSHNYTIKQLYERYKQTGIFFKENNYLDKYNTTSSGKKLAIYVLKMLIKEFRLKLLLRYPFDMSARFIGMKRGLK